jgi:hypothetical protein
MTYIFYDTETTGLEPAFDQILQFAAVATDDNFKVIEEVNVRCRLQPHVMASPGAISITRVGSKIIQSAPLSFYEMTRAMRLFIAKWSPAILIGFNSVDYDEKMLRQTFYQTLRPVYLTNTNGNTRMDGRSASPKSCHFQRVERGEPALMSAMRNIPDVRGGGRESPRFATFRHKPWRKNARRPLSNADEGTSTSESGSGRKPPERHSLYPF